MEFIDLSGEVCGGVFMRGIKDLEPIVWRQEWIPEVKLSLITQKNPKFTLSISDLDIAALLLGWILIEGVEVPLRCRHVAMYSYKTPTSAWTEKMPPKYLRQQEDPSRN